jgi:hypothetical protein
MFTLVVASLAGLRGHRDGVRGIGHHASACWQRFGRARHVIIGALLAGAVNPCVAGGVEVGLALSTLGPGLNARVSMGNRLAVRANVNGLTYGRNLSIDEIEYEADLKLLTGGLLLDWHPFAGHFRLSIGAYYNNNQIAVDGRPDPGKTYDIGGTSYAGSDLGSLNGQVTFNRFSPYLGLGWATTPAKEKGWGMSLDIGVLFQGSPSLSLSGTCSPTLPPATCTQLQSDIEAERVRSEEDVKNFRYFPVIMTGVSYKF